MVNVEDIDGLATLSFIELRQLWQELGVRKNPPSLKRLLVRELAWRIQQKTHGGVDTETRRLLKAAVRAVASEPRSPKPVARKRRGRGRRATLKTGAKLIRTWQGLDHEITVLESGKRFAYQGEVYQSLTEIAEKITGAHWSGPRLFGLDRLMGVG